MNHSNSKLDINSYLDKKVPRWARFVLEKIGKKKEVFELIDEIEEIAGYGNIPTVNDIYQALHFRFGITINENESSSNIPKDGPIIIASDHYRGMIDGLIHAQNISQARPGKPVKFLANKLVSLVHEVRGLTIATSDGTRQDTKRYNNEIHELFEQEGALTWFPSGRSIVDIPWKKRFLDTAKREQVSIVPAHIYGTEPSKIYKTAHQISYLIDSSIGQERRDAAIFNPGQLIRPGARYSAMYGKAIDPKDLEEYTAQDIKEESEKLCDRI